MFECSPCTCLLRVAKPNRCGQFWDSKNILLLGGWIKYDFCDSCKGSCQRQKQ